MSTRTTPLHEQQSEVMRDPPKPNEVNRLIGQRWKTVSVEEKTRYVEQVRLDKIRFSEVRWCIRTDTISVSR
ncbi:MAG: HMG-box domain-containing protein, partial [Bacteroidota bacterium]